MIASVFFARLIGGLFPTISTKILYKTNFNKKLNLKNPITLNEKILWLKLNDFKDNMLVTKCADKYLVREYIKSKGLENLLVELYSVHDTYKSIEFDNLPNSFVLKCNHAAGYNIICRDKSQLIKKVFYKQIKTWYKSDFWRKYTEIHYKRINKKIVIERILLDEQNQLPNDFKFYCFNGEPFCVMVCVERNTKKPKFYYYDKSWNLLKLSKDSFDNPDIKLRKPAKIDAMFEYARILSKDFKFVRVDFYSIEDRVYFGELTFTPSAGLDTSRLQQTDFILGEKLLL